jgi:hypothetical protein
MLGAFCSCGRFIDVLAVLITDVYVLHFRHEQVLYVFMGAHALYILWKDNEHRHKNESGTVATTRFLLCGYRLYPGSLKCFEECCVKTTVTLAPPVSRAQYLTSAVARLIWEGIDPR